MLKLILLVLYAVTCMAEHVGPRQNISQIPGYANGSAANNVNAHAAGLADRIVEKRIWCAEQRKECYLNKGAVYSRICADQNDPECLFCPQDQESCLVCQNEYLACILEKHSLPVEEAGTNGFQRAYSIPMQMSSRPSPTPSGTP